MNINGLHAFLIRPTHIAPLAVFRIAFGAIMCFSMLRFIANGWVHELYIEPTYFFTYYGFEWIKPLSEPLMYILFSVLAVSFLFQAIGLFYRVASIFSFFAFTYIEFLDKSNYLNHYYFVSIICLLLIFIPANRYFSLDVFINPKRELTQVPAYFILLIQLQLAMVYFFAGLAKLNYDWIVNAQPLKIWLPAKGDIPLLGYFLKQAWVAYLFSWLGTLYDLSIPFLLFYARSRWFAYFLVIIFHLLTYMLFQIGMFPFIMIGATLIFFSEKVHLKIINQLRKLIGKRKVESTITSKNLSTTHSKLLIPFFTLFLLFQLLIPFRYLAYPGNLYWTEEGYRFSWRVMLMEKAGYAIFQIKDPQTDRSWEINNYDFLTPNQEKMMSTQPDMILQFAHHLEKHYQKKGIKNPEITAEVYVSLNGRISKLLIDPEQDLTKIKESFNHKDWILPFEIESNHE